VKEGDFKSESEEKKKEIHTAMIEINCRLKFASRPGAAQLKSKLVFFVSIITLAPALFPLSGSHS